MATYPEYTHYRASSERAAGPAPAGSNVTPSDIEGPFYKAGAPFLPDGRLCPNPTLHLHGHVTDVDGNPASQAALDFWQANESGEYDNEGFAFRGKVLGRGYGHNGYELHTIRPGDYKIADDPPDFRCAHIHVIVTAPGHKSLTTQLYFKDDQYNVTDHWYDPRRVIGDDGRFDFVLEKV